ncbi:ABC transporter ATP-binding protein [Veillonella sp. 6_1_27]
MSEERCFQVKIPKSLSMRNVQAALMDDRKCVADAVPEAGAVRYIKTKEMLSIPWLNEYGMEEEPVQSRLEDTFMMLLKEDEIASKQGAKPLDSIDMDLDESAIEKERKHLLAPNEMVERPVEISVSHLVRTFGDFTAVANTSFTVQRGEVFGLLGPNGAGKTTTFRMLCGLLPVTSGDLRVAGIDVVKSRTAARSNFGYVAQKFSLYGNLSVMENLNFFAGVYGLHGQKKPDRIEAVISEFRLNDVRDMIAGDLPGGYKQRLSMAAALMHEPKILFLDEPTSGIDPLTRRNFWRQITSLSKRGTTIIITTHFMDESEYCDRIMIQDAGKLVVLGTPDEVRRIAGDENCTMDEAFISVILKKREQEDDV